jgi:preprotein translocase subunit SecA
MPLGVAQHIDASTGEDEMAQAAAAAPARPQPKPKRDAQNPSTWGKVGRNEPCPCGSGKKYKQCHGMVIA